MSRQEANKDRGRDQEGKMSDGQRPEFSLVPSYSWGNSNGNLRPRVINADSSSFHSRARHGATDIGVQRNSKS